MAGEASNFDDATGIGSVLLNRMAVKGVTFDNDNWLYAISVHHKGRTVAQDIQSSYNAYGGSNYNAVMGMSADALANSGYALRVAGANEAYDGSMEGFDYSNGAYIWNASSQQLPLMTPSEHVVQDYASVSLSLKAHPVSFIREKLSLLHVVANEQLKTIKDGTPIKVAGLVLVRQRPGTAKGICFITLEDETGCGNSVVFPNIFDKYRKAILQSRLLMIEGKLQREGEVIHVIAQRCHDLSGLLKGLTVAEDSDLPLLTLARGDEKSIPPEAQKTPGLTSQKEVFHGGRNFK